MKNWHALRFVAAYLGFNRRNSDNALKEDKQVLRVGTTVVCVNEAVDNWERKRGQGEHWTHDLEIYSKLLLFHER